LFSLAYDTENIDHFAPFFRKGIPIVFFDRVYPHADSTCIIIDNYTAAYTITKHLIDEGCRRIVHLGGNMLRNVYSERLRGHKQALKDHKIPFENKLVYITNLSEADGTESAEYILKIKARDRPHAVFSANDTAAAHCMIRLKNDGSNSGRHSFRKL
jgi:LacI family transcriptional regulator